MTRPAILAESQTALTPDTQFQPARLGFRPVRVVCVCVLVVYFCHRFEYFFFKTAGLPNDPPYRPKTDEVLTLRPLLCYSRKG
jgi:hypothetical protein